MRSKVISVLIADDNKEFTAVLSAFFRKDSTFRIVGVCHDGEEALRQIRQNKPDVVILDIIMPYMDGLEVLGRIKNMMAGYDPRIIVFSAVGQDNYTSRAIELGADFYFVKPFDMTLLSNRIKELFEKKTSEPNKENMIIGKKELSQNSELLDEVLYEMGVPKRLKGYQYIKESAEMIAENPNLRRKYTTDIYPAIALRHETKPENVERAIRNVIDVVYKNTFRETEKHFEFTKEGDLIKPSNSKFVEMVLCTMMEKRSINGSKS